MPLPWFKANIMVLEHTSGIYIKCVVISGSNGWVYMTLNIMHQPPDYEPWICKHMIDPRWSMACGAIERGPIWTMRLFNITPVTKIAPQATRPYEPSTGNCDNSFPGVV